MSGYRKLARATDLRRAMLRGIVTDVLKYAKVETTLMRAKEAQSIVDKMITLGKRGDLHARRQVMSYVFEPEVVYDLFNKTAAKYADRNGGYTRIYKLGARRGDGAETAILELVEQDA